MITLRAPCPVFWNFGSGRAPPAVGDPLCRSVPAGKGEGAPEGLAIGCLRFASPGSTCDGGSLSGVAKRRGPQGWRRVEGIAGPRAGETGASSPEGLGRNLVLGDPVFCSGKRRSRSASLRKRELFKLCELFKLRCQRNPRCLVRSRTTNARRRNMNEIACVLKGPLRGLRRDGHGLDASY